MLMICDGKKPVAVAGIMGGLDSEIKDSTKRILIESACFDPISVRKTSKKLGLNTEASHRFERGVDPLGTVKALNRAAILISEMDCGSLVGGIINECPVSIPEKTISLNINEVNRLLGIKPGPDQIKSMLEPVGFKVQIKNHETIDVIVPGFRVDVHRPQDIMEEIARISGYNNIQTTFPQIPAQAMVINRSVLIRNQIKNLMAGLGFAETINYSFVRKESCDYLRLGPDAPERNVVQILNPLTDDQSVMRTNMVPGLLETMARNISKQVQDIKIFEIGKCYFSKRPDTPANEIEILAGLWTGQRVQPSCQSKGIACDYYDIKGIVEGLLMSLNIIDAEFTANESPYTRPGHTALIRYQNKPLGLVGEAHPGVLDKYRLKQPAFIFELNLDTLIPLIPETVQATPIPKFPSTARDITLIIDTDIEAMDVINQGKKLNHELIEEIQLLDIYQGKPVPAGKKSILFRITYRSLTKTLEDDVINQLHKNIADKLIKNFNATVPV
jgi:phenylalanyl-tRNA synthetase beta chain